MQVLRLEKGDRPEMKHWDQNEHLSEVRSCFKFFVRCKEGSKDLNGEQAVCAMMDQLQKKFVDGERLDINQTKVFESFSFLLSPERLRQSTKLCNDILTSCQAHMISGASSSTDRPAKKAKKGETASSGTGTEKLDQMVLDLFS